MTPEGLIKKQIMEWLSAQPNCYVRVIQIGGIRGRANSSKGVSDIIGTWKGYALAIEVKAKGGKLSSEQEEFMTAWNKRGQGIAIVAYSLEDVKKALGVE